MSALYLYALLGERPRRPPGRGLAGERLRVLGAGPCLVVAGALPRPPRLTAPALRGHDATVRRLTRLADAVLPVRFGTLLADQRALIEALAPRGEALARALALVAGREQMTLRLYDGPGAARAGGPPRGVGPGARYLSQRLGASRLPDLAPLHRALARYVRAERVERHDRPPLLASLHHLVERGASTPYLAAVAACAGQLGLRVHPTGPWPAYAFAEAAA